MLGQSPCSSCQPFNGAPRLDDGSQGEKPMPHGFVRSSVFPCAHPCLLGNSHFGRKGKPCQPSFFWLGEIPCIG